MKKIIILSFICCILFNNINAQIKVDDILGKVKGLLGSKSLLSVKKGFSPKFSLGNLQLCSDHFHYENNYERFKDEYNLFNFLEPDKLFQTLASLWRF